MNRDKGAEVLWVGDPADPGAVALERAVESSLDPVGGMCALTQLEETSELLRRREEAQDPVGVMVVSAQAAAAVSDELLRRLFAAHPDLQVVVCRGGGRAARWAGMSRLQHVRLPRRVTDQMQVLHLAVLNALLRRASARMASALSEREGRVGLLEGEICEAQERLGEMRQEMTRSESDRAFMSMHDAVTGLPNRAALLRRIELELDLCKADEHHRFMLFLVDLHRFRVINGSLGSQHADTLLMEIGRRLKSLVRKDDLVARLGGDEFAVVVRGPLAAEQSRNLARRFLEETMISSHVDGRRVRVDAGLGAVVGSERYCSPDELLRDAGLALSRIDSMGHSGVVFFDPRDHLDDRLRMELEADLLGGIERGELSLQYQPIVFASSGRTAGFEALLRWRHARYGQVPPGLFIPVAERSRLILTLGDWVLERGLGDFKRIVAASGNPDLFLTLNVSRYELQQPEFATQMLERIAAHGLSNSSVYVEVTESATVDGGKALERALHELRQSGVRVLLDDFGVGQSSLNALFRMPVDGLKVDRAFVAASDSERGAAMFRSVVEMGRTLGLSIIAEGVETQSELDSAEGVRCDYAQGYFFSRSVDPQVAIDRLKAELADSPSMLAG